MSGKKQPDAVRKESCSPGNGLNSSKIGKFFMMKDEQPKKGSRAGLFAANSMRLSSPDQLLGTWKTGSCCELLSLLLLFLFMLKARRETKQFYKGS